MNGAPEIKVMLVITVKSHFAAGAVARALREHADALLDQDSPVGQARKGEHVCVDGIVEWDSKPCDPWLDWEVIKEEEDRKITSIYHQRQKRMPKPKITARDRNIYLAWRDGETLVEVGRRFNLSASRVSTICKRLRRLEVRAAA